MASPDPSTRSRLLAAATLLLARDGYRGLSVSELLRSAGAASGSLYHHFPGGKEEVAAAAIRQAGAAARALMLARVEEAGPGAALESFFGMALSAAESSEWKLGCPVGTPAGDGVSASAAVGAAVDESLGSWVDTLADALAQRGVGRDEASEAAALIIAAYEGSILLARARRDPAILKGSARRLAAYVEQLIADSASR